MNQNWRMLHAFFADSVQRHPQAIAVDIPPGRGRPDRQTITYAELARYSSAIARALVPHVAGESIVVILAGRDSPCGYAAQLAVLEAGAAFTCIDPAFPDDQIREVLADAGAVAVLADWQACTRIREAGFETPPLINILEAIEKSVDEHATSAMPWLDAHTLAYVTYTSGTTGRPKGVMIEHGSIVNLVDANLEAFDLGPGDRVGQSSSFAYDSSVEETWLAFASGATLVVMDDDIARLGPDLVAWLRGERITAIGPPPTLLRTTGCLDPESALPELRLIYVGGEALPADLAHRWTRGRRMVNGYGPTEATVTAIREQVVDGGDIAIGRPVRGVQAWVLNETGDEVPDGTEGELCLGGAGVARGYRNLPDLTAHKFPVHPRLGRMFRTGDLAHRASDGRFFFHGRLDSQVKLRGYRIELEAIEARLTECDGVRHAACCVQGAGSRQTLVAFVVPVDQNVPPRLDTVRETLARSLPAYMVPSRISILAALPTSVSGKLDRAKLPALDASAGAGSLPVAPSTPLERRLAAAFQQALNLTTPISIHDDFFRDLGGDSLAAAVLVSILREDQVTAAVSTRDVYDMLTVARLAERAASFDRVSPSAEALDEPSVAPAFRVVAATLVQGLWLLLELVVTASAGYLLIFHAVPWLTRLLGVAPVILMAPLLWILLRMALVPAGIAFTLLVKAALIGRYHPQRAPAWGSFHVRHWIVRRVARLIPWTTLAGTEFLNMTLRALGARVGQRVHIHRGVDVSRGGWDLLDIGDDVTLSADATLRLVDVDRGQIVAGGIAIGDRALVDVRAGMAHNTSLGADASLSAWSSLPEGRTVPAGERWDGIPAMPAGLTPSAPVVEDAAAALDPLMHAVVLVASRSALQILMTLPLALSGIVLSLSVGLTADSAIRIIGQLWTIQALSLIVMSAALVVPATVACEALAVRCLGATPEGVIGRWSWAYVPVCLKTQLVESAGIWLSGTLFWPVWLRVAGMRIGPKGEISTIIDTVPDLVELGSECFLADGIYLAGPRIDRGTVSLGRVRLGARTFIGNHAVVTCGTHLPDDVLLGVCTVADPDRVHGGTSWFGHPPMELPRREVVGADRRLTHDPSFIRFLNRVFWELLRCLVPAGLALVGVGWIEGLASAVATSSTTEVLFVAAPLWTLASTAVLCALVLALKWALLGRVRPGTHALWSCWCSRWDFLYVAWRFYGRAPLGAIEGTMWLSWYLRAMGMTIGRRVLLGDGFAQVVDPDMLVIGDDATVSAMFQAHTFEDRVLKIDRVHVGRGATVADATVPLYGADIGARTHVAAHSVVMKRERLTPRTRYEGVPTRPA